MGRRSLEEEEKMLGARVCRGKAAGRLGEEAAVGDPGGGAASHHP